MHLANVPIEDRKIWERVKELLESENCLVLLYPDAYDCWDRLIPGKFAVYVHGDYDTKEIWETVKREKEAHNANTN